MQSHVITAPGGVAGKKVVYKKSRISAVLAGCTRIFAGISFLILALLIGFIVVKGVGGLSPDLFALHYNSENGSLLPALFDTLFMTLLSLMLAVPIGVSAAVFLAEYAGSGNRTLRLIRLMTETLSGIPSIIFGLFGLLFFSTVLKLGYSMLSGALTMTLMILPLILRTTEEALLSVPDAYREASFGLGAGRLRTIWRICLPAAMPGILSGILLSVGRVAGETAALIFTAGTVAGYAGLMDSGRTLAVHMYVLSSEGLHMEKAYATALVLLVMVLVINTVSSLIARNVTKSER